MQLTEEIISIIWPWIEYMEDDPQEYRTLNALEVQSLQLTLLKVVEMLRIATSPAQES